jgi:sulfite reductase (NADPH) flavoprotein alpha-component
MNAIIPQALGPAPVPLIPESAPFTAAQRAWLNGFLAGLYGGAAVAGNASAASPPPAASAEDFPWRDRGLELDERLKLAEDRPLPRRLMAAMAQLDCGQCGYVCQSYAAALASGAETSTALCVPGAKATQKALKALLANAPAAGPKPVATTSAAPKGREVRFVSATRLTGEASAKDVRHVVLDLAESGLSYEAGDSLSAAAPNDPALVERILGVLGATGDAGLREELTDRRDIARPLDRTLDLLAATRNTCRTRLPCVRWRRAMTAPSPQMPTCSTCLKSFPPHGHRWRTLSPRCRH